MDSYAVSPRRHSLLSAQSVPEEAAASDRSAGALSGHDSLAEGAPKDLESGGPLLRSISSLTEPEDLKADVPLFAAGVDLVPNCSYCYTPFRKFVGNLKGFYCTLYMYVLLSLPLLVRTTFHTSYINFTESQPTLRTVEGILSYLVGVTVAFFLLVGDYFEALRIVIDWFRGDAETEVDAEPEVEIVKNKIFLKRGKWGIHWTTRNNVVAQNRPSSLYSWSMTVTIPEMVLHGGITSRWLLIGLYILVMYTLTCLLVVFGAKGINDSNYYLISMHMTNGMAGPLYIVAFVKIMYRLLGSVIKTIRQGARGKLPEPPKYTITGKKLIRHEIFAFLTDSCPCSYAVPKSSPLPKYYRYSTRYHTLVVGAYKFVFFVSWAVFSMVLVGLTFHSLATKANLRTMGG